ncbi:MAG: hypothetical protein ABIJ33_01365 [Patescibacteria group bacterium]|nr:hypothetical protein [Patescibacteria group bacterium]
MPRLSPIIHTMTLLLTLVATYLWLTTPTLAHYSLQAFAGTTLLYFILKKLDNSRLHHIAPAPDSLEMPMMTFALILIIGSTGLSQSIFYPLTYLYLLFLVMSTQVVTAVITTLGLTSLFFLLMPIFDHQHLAALFTLPLLLVLFILAKRQNEELTIEKIASQREHKAKEFLAQYAQDTKTHLDQANQDRDLNNRELVTLESFLETFLQPKLEYMLELIKDAQTRLVLEAQLKVIANRVQEILGQMGVKTKSTSTQHEPKT